MKRYNIDIEKAYGRGIYDGDEYSTLRVREEKNGEWVKAAEAEKMKEQIFQMQQKIDEYILREGKFVIYTDLGRDLQLGIVEKEDERFLLIKDYCIIERVQCYKAPPILCDKSFLTIPYHTLLKQMNLNFELEPF